jgi:hypothetical protein
MKILKDYKQTLDKKINIFHLKFNKDQTWTLLQLRKVLKLLITKLMK